MVHLFKTQNLDYQLVAPGNHRLLSAERAIQTFKNYFIAIRSGMHSHFPKRAWHHSLYQTVITLNILRPSRLNPDISTYMQVHGNHNFNKHSLAPIRCKIIIHNRTSERPSWSDHWSRGFYVGPAIIHYQNYVCFMSETKALRISNTVDFFPSNFYREFPFFPRSPGSLALFPQNLLRDDAPQLLINRFETILRLSYITRFILCVLIDRFESTIKLYNAIFLCGSS